MKTQTCLCKLVRVSVVLLMLSIVVGCASSSATVVIPSDADRELINSYQEAIAAAPADNTRELVNHARGEDGRRSYDMLTGKKPATAEQLDGARWYYQDKVRHLKMAKDWPAPKAVAVRRAASAIVVDGGGGDAAWANAVTIEIPYPNGRREIVPGATTSATCKLLWDDQNLYALYEVPDTNLCNKTTKRDEDVWMGDCVELFLTPDKRFGQYWEINVSAGGVIYDCLLTKYRHEWGDYARLDENIEGMKTAVSIRGTLNDERDKDEGYTVEIAVPWNQMPGVTRGFKAGDRIFGLIARADRQSNRKPGLPDFYSHTPIQAWFHNIWGHAEFVLE